MSAQENVTKSEVETTSTTTVQNIYTSSVQTYTMPQLNPATIGGSTTTNSVSHVMANQTVVNTTCSKYT